MLTIFSVPRSFKNVHFKKIQTNAITSWSKLDPKCNIVLLGDDEGIEDFCRERNLGYIKNVEKSDYKTPLLNSVFCEVFKKFESDYYVYINSDIILFQNFMDSFREISKILIGKKFLIIGKRANLNIDNGIDFSTLNWQKNLINNLSNNGVLQNPKYIDYFVFPKILWSCKDIKPFIVGRTIWDNWLVYIAKLKGAKIIDCSSSITAIHQEHAKIQGSKIIDFIWNGPESKTNWKLCGNRNNMLDISHSDYIFKESKLEKTKITKKKVEIEIRLIFKRLLNIFSI